MNIYVDFSLRLFVAGLMGVLIGLEREYRAKEAGYRTHFLVALGSALLMIVSQYGFMDVLEKDLVRLDPSRLAAHDRITDVQTLRADDVATFAVSIQHERDMSGTVRIVFNAFDAGGNTVLVTQEVNHTIVTLGATTLVTARNVTVVVTAGAAILLFQQSCEGLALVQARSHHFDRMTAAGGRRLEFDESHYLTSCTKLML